MKFGSRIHHENPPWRVSNLSKAHSCPVWHRPFKTFELPYNEFFWWTFPRCWSRLKAAQLEPVDYSTNFRTRMNSEAEIVASYDQLKEAD
jgi:hypothetical protein